MPIEFILFALTLGGVAVFHRRALEVALSGLAVIVLYKLTLGTFPAGAGMGGLLTHLGHEWVVVAISVWTALYILVFEPLGFMLSTAIYLLVLTACFNRGRWLMNVLTSVLFTVISYFAFTKLLGVNLAPGILPF